MKDSTEKTKNFTTETQRAQRISVWREENGFYSDIYKFSKHVLIFLRVLCVSAVRHTFFSVNS